MPAIRNIHFPQDEEGILVLDTSFETDRIYTVQKSENSFRLVEAPLSYRKRYSLQIDEIAHFAAFQYAVVAEINSRIVGIAAAEFAVWNRRVILHHLYVDRANRGAGIGRLLLANVSAWSCSIGGQCLWLETQNVNFAAIRFYRRAGFDLCGLDTSLYDSEFVDKQEVGIFLSKPIP